MFWLVRCSRHSIPPLEKNENAVVFFLKVQAYLRIKKPTAHNLFKQHIRKQAPLQSWHCGGLVCVFMFAFYTSHNYKEWNIPIAQSITDCSLNKTLCFFCLTTHTGLGKTRWFVQLKHSVAYTLEGREAISKGSARYVFTARVDETRKIRRWIAYPLKVSVLVCCSVFCLILLCLIVDKINDSQKMANFFL